MKNKHKILITIAGITIEINSPLSAAELGIQDRLMQFSNSVESPFARLRLIWEETKKSPKPRGKLIYDPGSIWKMYKEGAHYYALISYEHDGSPAKAECLLQSNPDWNVIKLIEHRTDNTWRSLLNAGAGELIVRSAIVPTGGLIFHASGLDDNGTGILFIGHSGAGKSTQAELWKEEAGVTVMNDDRIAVRIENGTPVCYGIPWAGTADIALNHSVPLFGLILLEKAPVKEIQRIKPSEAAPLLAATAFLPYWDSALMIKAMDNLNNILEHVPVYRLRCRPEKEVIPLVRTALC